jgi:hypothetical protein
MTSRNTETRDFHSCVPGLPCDLGGRHHSREACCVETLQTQRFRVGRTRCEHQHVDTRPGELAVQPHPEAVHERLGGRIRARPGKRRLAFLRPSEDDAPGRSGTQPRQERVREQERCARVDVQHRLESTAIVRLERALQTEACVADDETQVAAHRVCDDSIDGLEIREVRHQQLDLPARSAFEHGEHDPQGHRAELEACGEDRVDHEGVLYRKTKAAARTETDDIAKCRCGRGKPAAE